MLAVHAHPDDETLSTGALLATWAAAGLPVTVVTCTRGERGEVIPAGLAHLEGSPELAAHRVSELRDALASLGVGDHVLLDEVEDAAGAEGARFADSGMAWVADGRAGAAADLPPDAFVAVPVDDAAHRLLSVLRDRRPAVVVGYEPDGGYGHPDHVHAHRVLMRAVELLEPDERPLVLWAAVDERVWRRAVADLGPVPTGTVRIDPTGGAPSAVVVSGQVDVRIDVVPVLDRVLGALAAHATQVRLLDEVEHGPAALGAFALSNDVVQPLLPQEAYRVVSGGVWDGWPDGVVARVP
nr:PIG-L family deacetylase [Cellulomonas sp. APG4]